jgi:hypothetical protein
MRMKFVLVENTTEMHAAITPVFSARCFQEHHIVVGKTGSACKRDVFGANERRAFKRPNPHL